ncbi:E3 ubiquitin-protein ligase TRIM47-like isoform X1 [Larimichthys crocea]|uniref:E3 ubiquitin-protein ligase TRIM47-like isoform X1 n=2 Tax=Larimichthys crocea TaxID=215358 RepID=UPI000F5F484F|nr:E3 ubiquitin-protein ligase TRIM47-like isoform X1 [Larimichthys crocea]
MKPKAGCAHTFITDMATASPFLSEDQFQCSICLDVFTEPVSIPCGHNFCKACITRHWEGKEQCQCPLCNEKFNKGLKLCVNTGFREVVENFKKHHAKTDNNSQIKPGEVPCDCCTGSKCKALKTCLVCLTSFCETHLEPHQRVATLKGHKLTNPIPNLEDKICKKHNRILEPLCSNDLTRVCDLCAEHTAYNTVLLEETYDDNRAQTRKKKAEVQEIKPKRGKKAKKTKALVQTQRKDKECPLQFKRYFYLPGCMGFFGGKFFYEVDTKGMTGWDLGIVTESNLQKRTFTPTPRNGNWIIRLENNTSCRALHDFYIPIFLLRKPERVRVFVDYDNGEVSFCDADTGIWMCSFTDCKFNERVFLFYRPNISWVQALQNKVQKIKDNVWPQLSYFLLGCILLMIILISDT